MGLKKKTNPKTWHFQIILVVVGLKIHKEVRLYLSNYSARQLEFQYSLFKTHTNLEYWQQLSHPTTPAEACSVVNLYGCLWQGLRLNFWLGWSSSLFLLLLWLHYDFWSLNGSLSFCSLFKIFLQKFQREISFVSRSTHNIDHPYWAECSNGPLHRRMNSTLAFHLGSRINPFNLSHLAPKRRSHMIQKHDGPVSI